LLSQLSFSEEILHFEFNQPVFNSPSQDECNRMAIFLKSAGLTLSTSRINISHHLSQTSIPYTALELSRILKIPLSTVHRNLSVLSESGIAGYLIDRSGISRWFLVSANHANFCPCCNQEYTSTS